MPPVAAAPPGHEGRRPNRAGAAAPAAARRIVWATTWALLAFTQAANAAEDAAVCRWGGLPLPASTTDARPALVPYSLAIHYVVPTNVSYNAAVLARIKSATRNILAWYQCASGGRTWVIEYPETVRVYLATQTREYYLNNGNWWGSLLGEMGSAGYPIWSPGKVAAIWAHGAGWWAGAAQWCGVDCGVALLGVEIFPEFNNVGYSGGSCPGGVGVGGWPCTPEGAYAHELGHTVGLPHPADVPATSAVASRSIMQTHWNYPTYAPPGDSPWGFLTLERQTIHANPFMAAGVPLNQIHDCALVNLPSTGAAPTATFATTGTGAPLSMSFSNTSSGATENYWTFGDGAVSALVNPSHTYAEAGSYTVKLRTYAANGMMAAATAPPVVVDAPLPMVAKDRLTLIASGPSPFAEFTKVALGLPRGAMAEVTVLDASGRRVARLARGFYPPGVTPLVWDGRDDGDRIAPAGVYLIRARSGTEQAVLRVVKLE